MSWDDDSRELIDTLTKLKGIGHEDFIKTMRLKEKSNIAITKKEYYLMLWIFVCHT